MKELTIWRTYHDDSQLVDYSLKEEGAIKLFKGNVLVEGENINHLNQFYSEMTTMYWVWKNNVRSKKVGFCHYRRVFSRVIDIQEGECQVMHINHFGFPIFRQYKSAHNYQDYYDVVDILNDFYGKDNPYAAYMMNSNIFIPFCSFIMHYEDFASLCEFFFPVLFEYDRRHGLNLIAENYQRKAERDFRHDNVNYQRRTMSFLAERLISCYIVNHLKPICVSTLNSFQLQPKQ
mgnify:CR=1 FL=1